MCSLWIFRLESPARGLRLYPLGKVAAEAGGRRRWPWRCQLPGSVRDRRHDPEVLQRLLPNVQVKLIDRCGHLPQIEYSDMFNEAALSFLAEVERLEVGAPAASPTAAAVNVQ